MSVSILKQDDAILTCSWDVLNERNIENALTFGRNSVKKQKNDLECIVSLESCVQLGTCNVALPCTLDIKLLPTELTITGISVVSEARIIELYGQCGEYLTTSHAEFIDECEGMAVYMAECKLPQASSECLLKFARLKTKGKMWLYGIHITIDTAESSILCDKTVNFQNVNKILKESSHQLTEKADKCKKFLQMYYSSYRDQSKSQSIPNPQALLKIFEAEYLAHCNPIGSQAKNVSKCLADLIPGFTLSPKGKFENSMDKASVAPVNSQELTTLSEELKCHIDQRFNELEKMLLLRVDEKLNEFQRNQSEKLDKILNLIQDLKDNSVNKKVCCE